MRDSIDELIEREGGFSNDPTDHGGPTKFGITQAQLSQWRGKPTTVADVAALEQSEARAIYVKRFLSDPHIDQIPHIQLRNFVLDIAVMSGPNLAIKLLQQVLHDEHGQTLLADGVIGVNTLHALWGNDDPEKIQLQLVRRRAIWLADLVQHDPSQLKYLEGWIRRTMDWLPGL